MSDNEFQTDGPDTEKVRRPNILSWQGSTTSRRLTDRRKYSHTVTKKPKKHPVKPYLLWLSVEYVIN